MSAAATEARFVLPPGSEATAPPEARGLARDEVRMAVVTQERTHHRQARELPTWLEPGDLLVVNTSATLPSALEVQGTAARGGCTSRPSSTTAPGWSSCGGPTAPARAARSPVRCCGCPAACGCASRRRTRQARPGCGGRRPCQPPTGWPTSAATAADPLPLPARRVADRGPAERLRRRPRQRGDAERRPTAVARGAGRPDVRRRRGGAAGAAHRRGEPGVARAAPAGVAVRSRSRPPGWSTSPARPVAASSRWAPRWSAPSRPPPPPRAGVGVRRLDVAGALGPRGRRGW